ncbi:MAG: lysophospholipid acyltransferase family protein [Candidatus Cloacimonetes bacterium]|nr:lysophospholipid acyltransferase family protein [Candidatus Cloacimonadota bacterium]
MNKELKSRIEFGLFIFIYRFFKLLPYSLVRNFLQNLFIFGGYIIGIRKKVAYNNLTKVFKDKSDSEKKKIIKLMYKYMGRTTAEIYFGDEEKLFQETKIIGKENLDNAVKMEKGVILATAHMGNWESSGKIIHRYHNVAVIYKKQRNQYFDEFNNKLRTRNGIILIRNQRSEMRTMFKLLKQNYILAILMDQHAGSRGILTTFLGLPASSFPGTARIAIKLNCPILPGVAVRDKKGNNVLICEKMILPDDYANDDRGIKRLTEDVTNVIEKLIIKYPEQWFWVHKRWKSVESAKVID